MYYLIDLRGGVAMVDGSPVEYDTEEEAERWADANMKSRQVMEGSLRASDVHRPQQARADYSRP
jgi:hypothetical protein